MHQKELAQYETMGPLGLQGSLCDDPASGFLALGHARTGNESGLPSAHVMGLALCRITGP